MIDWEIEASGYDGCYFILVTGQCVECGESLTVKIDDFDNLLDSSIRNIAEAQAEIKGWTDSFCDELECPECKSLED